jgi:hypothetical protein
MSCVNNLVARGGIEPPTFRFSGGLGVALELFALVRLDAGSAIRRVGSARLTRWPHLGPMKITPTTEGYHSLRRRQPVFDRQCRKPARDPLDIDAATGALRAGTWTDKLGNQPRNNACRRRRQHRRPVPPHRSESVPPVSDSPPALHGLAACLDHLVFRKIDETRRGGSGGAEEADAFGHAGHARFESIWVQAPNSSLIPTVSIAAQVSSTMCATITRSR